MDFLLNVLIWVGVVIFALFFIGFMAAVKLNKRQDRNSDDKP
jgi:ABC-type sugar transport system permease subunit